MAVDLTDVEIDELIAEQKPLPANYTSRLQLRRKRGRHERHLDLKGGNGGEYCIIVSQSDTNALAFSVVLLYRLPESNKGFRLRRYNGKAHQHTNKIEQQTFYNQHIHMATERYQDLGLREDSYAEKTGRFADVESALACLVKDCAFELPTEGTQNLFEEGP